MSRRLILSETEQQAMRQKAAKKLRQLASINDNQETAELIERLKWRFSICEITYKTLLVDYFAAKKTAKQQDQLKLHMNQITSVLNMAGYDYDYDLMSKLFGRNEQAGNRSVKYIRDNLNHEMSSSVIQELIAREKELFGYMDRFMIMINNGDKGEIES